MVIRFIIQPPFAFLGGFEFVAEEDYKGIIVHFLLISVEVGMIFD